MLVIRLARTGKKHQAYFRVVVADSKRAVTAKFIEILGNYDPHAKKIAIDKEKLQKYLANGAQPSQAVAKLLLKEKIELPKWVKVAEKKKAPKKEVEVKAEPKEASKEQAEPVESTEGGEQAESVESSESNESVEPTEEAKEADVEAAPEPTAESSEPVETTEKDEEKEEVESSEEKDNN